MPITINGTTVITNSINGTSISNETINGTQVYGGAVPKSKVWVLTYIDSSEPTTDFGTIESSSSDSNWLTELTVQYPPNNYVLGLTAAVWDGSTVVYYVYQIQEV